MAKIGDVISADSRGKAYLSSIEKGFVYKDKSDDADYKKWYLVVGINAKKKKICLIYINSERRTSGILQFPINSEKNSFLHRDSIASAAKFMEITFDEFRETFGIDVEAYIGQLHSEDIEKIVKGIKSDKSVKPYIIKTYFT